jgi:hypothetical protein
VSGNAIHRPVIATPPACMEGLGGSVVGQSSRLQSPTSVDSHCRTSVSASNVAVALDFTVLPAGSSEAFSV